MKIVFAINHPAQYYLFKNTYNYLKNKGNQVTYVIRDKDILEKLLVDENQKYIKLNSKKECKSKISIILNGIIDLIIQDLKLLRVCLSIKPTIMLGTDYCITHVGFLLRIPSIVLNEDDFEVNRYFCRLAYPLASIILSPNVCNVGTYSHKKIGYDGFQKLAYLHPYYFKANIEIVNKYFDASKEYILLRLVQFTSGHDVESKHSGISLNVLEQLINKFERSNYRVYISSEGQIPSEYEKYRLKIKLNDIHHIMSFSELFIADSQSMIVEASILGVPSIRFNSFVDKISVLNELEYKYQLTNGVKINDKSSLFNKIDELLTNKTYKESLLKRNKLMLLDKINLTAFLIWLLENFPDSKNIMKANPDYQKIFK